MDNKALAAKVAVYRIFGPSYKAGAKEAMAELMKRKLAGSDFDYEAYINEKVSSIKLISGPEKAKMIRDTVALTVGVINNGT